VILTHGADENMSRIA